MNLNYNWTLKDAKFTKDRGTVFSCFACGGGSTMGYKLAGFDVIGCNEIDPKIIEVYKVNHNPKYAYCEGIQTFKLRNDLPKELFELDILDGSPPCSSFSMAGNREKDWGKSKKFKEGQANQVLDTLFFDFIDLAERLQPKVVIAENVKGLLLGNAKEYVRQIYKDFDRAGYIVQHFLLDASKMGVPQRRERVFFVALRKDLCEPFMQQSDMFTELPGLRLDFNEKEILFSDIMDINNKQENLSIVQKKLWDLRIKSDTSIGDICKRVENRDCWFSHSLLHKDRVMVTQTSSTHKQHCLYDIPRYPSVLEMTKSQSFPLDYNFNGTTPGYLLGMSVPPLMTARIANEIYIQWLSKLHIETKVA